MRCVRGSIQQDCTYYVQNELCIGVGHANILQQVRQVVRADIVATELAKPAEGDIQHEPIPSSSTLHKHTEVEEVSPVGHAFLSKRVGHLGHLKLDNRMSAFTVGMILRYDSSGLVGAVLAYQPSRAFGHPQYAYGHKARTKHLQPKGQSPIQVTIV